MFNAAHIALTAFKSHHHQNMSNATNAPKVSISLMKVSLFVLRHVEIVMLWSFNAIANWEFNMMVAPIYVMLRMTSFVTKKGTKAHVLTRRK